MKCQEQANPQRKLRWAADGSLGEVENTGEKGVTDNGHGISFLRWRKFLE